MKDETDDEDLTPWTRDGAAALRAAAAEVARLVLAHAETVIAMKPGTAEEEVDAESEKLLPALRVWDNRLWEFAETMFPFWSIEDDLDDGEGNDDNDSEDVVGTPSSGVTVLQRIDYAVTDEAAVLRAGQDAYRRVWPEDGEEQAARDASHLGAALYQVAHADGWDSLAKIDGLRPVGGQVVVLRQENLLSADPDDWPDNLFDGEGDVLFTQGDVFPRPHHE